MLDCQMPMPTLPHLPCPKRKKLNHSYSTDFSSSTSILPKPLPFTKPQIIEAMFRSSWILCAHMSSVLIALITLPSVRTTHREYSSTPQQCGIHYSLDGDLAELATASTVRKIQFPWQFF
jgi:hypothetical protein